MFVSPQVALLGSRPGRAPPSTPLPANICIFICVSICICVLYLFNSISFIKSAIYSICGTTMILSMHLHRFVHALRACSFFVMPNRPGRVLDDLRWKVTSAFLGVSGEPVRRGYKDLKARYSMLDTRHLILDARHLTPDTT